MKSIGINIWDDFWEDGLTPEGEIQETFLYIEENISEKDKRNIIGNLFTILARFFNNGKIQCIREDDKIYIKHITHRVLEEEILPYLNNLKLTYNKTSLYFYSES